MGPAAGKPVEAIMGPVAVRPMKAHSRPPVGKYVEAIRGPVAEDMWRP